MRSPRKFSRAFTYKPKIPDIKAGICRHTIRPLGKSGMMMKGDQVTWHGWSGRAYASPWNWRIKTILSGSELMCVTPRGIFFPERHKIIFWEELDWLAKLDGIEPPTGKELGILLTKRINKIKNPVSPFQRVWWDEIQCQN